MPTPSIWLASAIAAGVAGRISSNSPLTESPRTHFIWVIFVALILSPAITYIDANNQIGANFQATAIENAIIVFFAYAIGVLASYIAEQMREWSLFQ